jgi:hypothetical protein
MQMSVLHLGGYGTITFASLAITFRHFERKLIVRDIIVSPYTLSLVVYGERRVYSIIISISISVRTHNVIILFLPDLYLGAGIARSV